MNNYGTLHHEGVTTLSNLRSYPKNGGSEVPMAEIMGLASTNISTIQSLPSFPRSYLYSALLCIAVLASPCVLHSITLWLIAFCCATTATLYIFAFYHRTRYIQLLYHCGALYPPDLKDNYHLHRLLCPIFLHVDPIHLGFNIVTMAMICIPFEKKLVGQYWFIMFYLLSGIAGNLLTGIIHSKGIAVGASTSLFGILAAFEVHSRFSPYPVFYPISWQYWLSLLIFHVYLFAFGGKYIKVDPWGHLGGFVMGVLIGISKFLYWYIWFSIPSIFILLSIILYLTK